MSFIATRLNECGDCLRVGCDHPFVLDLSCLTRRCRSPQLQRQRGYILILAREQRKTPAPGCELVGVFGVAASIIERSPRCSMPCGQSRRTGGMVMRFPMESAARFANSAMAPATQLPE